MRECSGRSLIEIIGVLAITGIITAGAFAMYKTISNRQKRLIASTELQNIVENAKLLLSYTSDYSTISVDFLIESGALKNNKAPIGTTWSITPSFDLKEFSINLNGLSYDDCVYFTTTPPTWSNHIQVNGHDSSSGDFCMSSGNNQISLYSE